MAQQKTNALQAALNQVDEPEAPKLVKAKLAPKKVKAAPKPSRAKTALIGGHFDTEIKKQLRIIAAEEETTTQALLGEALTLLFKKKGVSIKI